MAVDINEILIRFRQATITAVGSRLATLNDGTTPAIFYTKDRFPVGTYPMVLIEVGNRRKQGSHTTYRHYDTLGNTVISIAYDYFVTLTVITDHTGNAQQIADDLEASFVRNDITEIFTIDGLGTPAETFGVDNNVFKEGSEVKQVSSLIVRFTAVNVVTEVEPEIQTLDANFIMRYPNSDVDVISGNIQAQDN